MEVWATTVEHNGSPAILANVIDITERKRAEEALKESEERYRQAYRENSRHDAINRSECEACERQ